MVFVEAEPAPPTSETVIAGRYRLGRRVGVGGAADVFAAHDMLLARSVAVKLFHTETELAQRDRIEAETRMLAGLHHPGIVTIFDAGGTDEDDAFTRPFIVMELVAGPSLKDHLASGPLPSAEVGSVARDLARTLSYLHEHGVVHRDVKPANVLLDAVPDAARDAPFTAKLSDFGIAMVVDSARVTSAGLTVGTANYLAPEQLRGGEIGPSVDIYSLGLLLIEAFSGVPAFPGHGVEAAMPRLTRDPEIPHWVPEGWATLLRAMTAGDPVARPTAVEVVAALEDAAALERPAVMLETAATLPTAALVATLEQVSDTAVLPTVTGLRTRRRGWWTGAGVLLAGGAVAAAFSLSSGSVADTDAPPDLPAVAGTTETSAVPAPAPTSATASDPPVRAVSATSTAARPKAGVAASSAPKKVVSSAAPKQASAAPKKHGKAKGKGGGH
jgi:hypothetical protein